MLKVKTIITSIQSAMHGIQTVWREERNLRIESCCGIVALALALILRFSFQELAILSIVIFLVLATEMLNSAVEHYIDIIKPRVSVYVGKIKDITAGAVLLLSCMSLIVALLLYVPKIVAVIIT